jgi:hypothetical protein
MLWSILTSFAEQHPWPIDGEMDLLSPMDWKDVLSASYKEEHLRLSQTMGGRKIMLGMRTSRMTKEDFTDFLEYIMAIAAERGIKLKEDINGIQKDV